jgi:hypothetical protein
MSVGDGFAASYMQLPSAARAFTVKARKMRLRGIIVKEYESCVRRQRGTEESKD